jgi:hypothetical protein
MNPNHDSKHNSYHIGLFQKLGRNIKCLLSSKVRLLWSKMTKNHISPKTIIFKEGDQQVNLTKLMEMIKEDQVE